MSLKDKLREDATVALKAGEKLKLAAIRSAIGAVDSAEKSGKVAQVYDDKAVLNVIRKQVKQRYESAEAYESAGRQESAAQELAEAAYLEAYLPQELSDGELIQLAKETIDKLEPAMRVNFGAAMKSVVAAAGGLADGGRISATVRGLLS